ncbi:APC family permease [Frankia sp. CNm7]|uniref:APC family permease n=1 Tax=Frankia nepalensis TaxID=1836974 RepID=A0A937RBV8_9ACTN|nr:APC family permease [Frankia nepalensis]MBL7500446.1 APC family permease [Frankia nepalensis]MBL7511193.1 APC family permease [Frankia nepalensis]MBL7519083.1 APC family permease [Frankia nepalensis]MBL7626967.1 APC family permease [Frankia nepalensis]
MSVQSEAAPPVAAGTGEVQRLKPGTIGLFAVLFMVTANAAPITAMTGNTPIAVGYGDGFHGPAAFLVATVILTIFSIGYVAMTKHITATGAFYGFISHGLGQAMGMAAGFLATMCYIVFEASLIGILSSFAKTTMETVFSAPEVSWVWYGLVSVVVIAILGYFNISISGKVLGVFLVTEVLLLLAMAFGVLVTGGGPDGLVPEAINPVGAFESVAPSADGAIVGVAGLGIFFALWSWVGFETTAVYGEESKDPKKIVPRATMIAVIGLGVFYTFVSWMAVAYSGKSGSIEASRTDAFSLFYAPTEDLLGAFCLDLYKVMTVTGSFACALAFHNAASRYLYAIGREGLASGLDKTLGASHKKHGSPHISSLVQTAITLVIVLLFFFLQKPTDEVADVPYVYLYGLMAILGTMALLFVQSISSIAVIGYFHIRKMHPETASWWRTLLMPILGAGLQIYVIVLLFQNLDFAAGAASGSPVFKASPWIALGVFVLGLAVSIGIRLTNPEKYATIGRIVMEESHERAPEGTLPPAGAIPAQPAGETATT